VHRAFGRQLVTFMLGFAVMSSITSAAALSRAFGGDYLSEFVDLPTILVGLVVVGPIALLNFRGIGESAKVNVAFTLIELGGLLLVLLIGVVFVAGGDGDPGRAFEFKEDSDSVPFLVLAGASLAFYALIGFEDSVNIADATVFTTLACSPSARARSSCAPARCSSSACCCGPSTTC